MTRIFQFLFLLAILLIAGCASVPMASPDQDANAKQFTPESGKASVYIYRNDSMGAMIPLTIEVNGQKIGQIVSKSYFKLNLNPGTYTIAASAKNDQGLAKSNDSTLSLTVDAGKNYYVWDEVGAGLLFASNNLQTVDEITGREYVTAAQLTMASTSDAAIPATARMAGDGQSGGSAASSNPYNAKNPNVIFGTSGVVVEKLAVGRNCQPVTGATLFYKNGPMEDYRVKCTDGSELAAHCEYRQCVLK